MASQTFSIASGAEYQTTAAVAVGANEKVRVRFTGFPQNGEARFIVSANAVNTYYNVTDRQTFVLDGVFNGDSVSLEVRRNSGTFSGIIETGI